MPSSPRALLLLLLLLAAGCGRFGYDPTSEAVPLVCTSGSFGPAEPVTGLGLAPDLYGAKLSTDGTTLVLSQAVAGNPAEEDLFRATRLGPTSFAAATPLPGLNTSSQEGTPFVSFDGLTLLFSSERPGGLGDRDLWLATRPSTAADFTLARNLGELNSTSLEHTASLSPDGRVVYFASNRGGGGGGGEDLYRATRAAPGDAFGPPARVDELRSPDQDTSVYIARDGLTVYFMSDRAGGPGCTDLWFATRADPDGAFSPPAPMTELNTADCEDDPSLSADGCEIFFSSNRGGSGYQIYRATRGP